MRRSHNTPSWGHRAEEWTLRKGLDLDVSESPEPRRDRSKSPRKKDSKRETVFKRLEKGVFHMLRDKGKSEDPEYHLKIFQAAAKMERWAMPTWCHMFNSALTGNARKKCIKDLVEIHNIKQRDGESMEEFVWRYKLKCRDVKGALECMKIFGFMHGITNPELIKRLHDKIPKSVDKMMRVTTAFLREEVVASNRE
ncbi:hypothetical protein Tco_1405859 [Tanacetum coccineum]